MPTTTDALVTNSAAALTLVVLVPSLAEGGGRC